MSVEVPGVPDLPDDLAPVEPLAEPVLLPLQPLHPGPVVVPQQVDVRAGPKHQQQEEAAQEGGEQSHLDGQSPTVVTNTLAKKIENGREPRHHFH